MMRSSQPATVAMIDADLRNTYSRYERAIAEDNTDLAAAYWLDFDKLLDRRLELDG